MQSNALSAVDTERMNSERFFDQLDRCMGACIGVIAVRTREQDRACSLLHEWASIREMSFNKWSPVSGLIPFKPIPIASKPEGVERPTISSSDDNSDYLTPLAWEDSNTIPLDRALEKFSKRFEEKQHTKNRFCGVFVGINQQVMDNATVQQHFRDHVQRSYQCDDRMFIVMPPGVSIPDQITNDVEIIDLATPSFAELLESLDDLGDTIKDQLGVTLPEHDQHIVVQNGMGMTQQEFENAIALAIVDLTKLRHLDEDHEIGVDDFVKVVRERKLEILKDTKILELMPTARMEDVGGLDLAKKWIDQRRLAFDPRAKEFGIKPPKGFIAVGPPGGGKSLLTQAVCAAFGQAGIRFDVGKLFGSYVGQSEETTRMALSMLEDMAPCVVQIEEIEKAFGSGGGSDGGTTSRVFGTILTWIQDKTDRGIPITIVASANDVTKIPPELLRKGRFDAIFGIDLPTMEERMAILKIHAKKRGHTLTEAEYKELARASDKYVGAELEAAIEEALFEDFEAGNDGLTADSVRRSLENTRTQASMFPERMEQMIEFVQNHGKPASSGSSFDISKETIGDLPKVVRPRPGPRIKKLRSSSN